MSLSPAQQRAYLDAMGIQVWQPRGAVAEGQPPVPAPDTTAHKQDQVSVSKPSITTAPAMDLLDVEAMDWNRLQQAVAQCTRCGLHETRTRTVFGAGDPKARWLLVGEAPGEEEDRQGLPFVGRAGNLLSAMLQAVGLQRDQVYIANILKCRPPGNRDPHSDEVHCCTPYLQRQVALLQPRLILAVGRVAAQHLLQTDKPIGKLRGKVHAYGEAQIPLVATYHPAYLLRSPAEKRKAWEDLLLALSLEQRASGP